jgi:hypothetical protein
MNLDVAGIVWLDHFPAKSFTRKWCSVEIALLLTNS